MQCSILPPLLTLLTATAELNDTNEDESTFSIGILGPSKDLLQTLELFRVVG